jgi:hypothetical protein
MTSKIDANETVRDFTRIELLRSQFMDFLLQLAWRTHYIRWFASFLAANDMAH